MAEVKLSNPRLSALLQKALDSLAAPEPSVTPEREAYRKAACVFAAFEPFKLKPFPATSASSAAFHLLEDCTVVNSHREGKILWSLKPEVRREALKSLGSPAAFSQALEK